MLLRCLILKVFPVMMALDKPPLWYLTLSKTMCMSSAKISKHLLPFVTSLLLKKIPVWMISNNSKKIILTLMGTQCLHQLVPFRCWVMYGKMNNWITELVFIKCTILGNSPNGALLGTRLVFIYVDALSEISRLCGDPLNTLSLLLTLLCSLVH